MRPTYSEPVLGGALHGINHIVEDTKQVIVETMDGEQVYAQMEFVREENRSLSLYVDLRRYPGVQLRITLFSE